MSVRTIVSQLPRGHLFRQPLFWPRKLPPTGIRKYTSVPASELRLGQPLHETHPHLLKAGEITPGITALEYHRRRSRLAASLPENAIAILQASDIKYRSGAVFYEFHQESNFFYLTGFIDPKSVAVIQNIGARGSGEYVFHLFVRPKDKRMELWEGPISGEQAALDVFNADKTGDISDLPSLLSPLIRNASEVFTDLEMDNSSLRFFTKSNSMPNGFQSVTRNSKVKPLKPLMNGLRIIKSDAEIENMRQVGRISGLAFTNAMRRQWHKEKDLGAFLDYKFRTGGCDSSAYVPVVAGGKNALTIHYVRNDNVLRDGDMVLVDAGGELGGYITDITRTWPVSGKFSKAQRDLYEMVLQIQRQCVSLCREDAALSLDKIHEIAEHGFVEGLKQLGFDTSGNTVDLLFPHHVGHYIGLDVHDCPGYPRTDLLRSGQCITVEPGIYVPDDERWPKHFRGLGIRIEDSVCVKEESPLILTTEAVKEVLDIEALRD